jgi:hypothetical protein
MERAGRQPGTKEFWTDAEESLLRQLYARGWAYDAIGRALNRTRHECSRKVLRLGLPARDSITVGFKGWRRRRVA